MNPSTLIFLGLAVVWVVVLLPEAARKLSSTRSRDSIRSFNQQLSGLHRSGARSVNYNLGTPSSDSNVIDLRSNPRTGAGAQFRSTPPRQAPASVRKRRQEVLTALGAAAVLTLLCTVAFGSVFLILHLIADALLVTYVALLAQLTKTEAARANRTQRSETDFAPIAPADYGLRTATVGQVGPAPRRVAN